MEHWPIASDLIESLESLQAMEEAEDEDSNFTFDPSTFTRSNPSLSMQEFGLDVEGLRQWAVTASEI